MDLDQIYKQIELLKKNIKINEDSIDEFYTFIAWQVINFDSPEALVTNPAITVTRDNHIFATLLNRDRLSAKRVLRQRNQVLGAEEWKRY